MKTPDSLIGSKGGTLKKLIKLVPERKGALRNIIFGDTVSHVGVLAKVDLTKFKNLFLKYFRLTNSNGLNKVVQSIKDDNDITDVRLGAYMLATVYHETTFSFNPVREGGKGSASPA